MLATVSIHMPMCARLSTHWISGESASRFSAFAHLLGEYLGVTEGIRRRRVSIDEARAGASGNQTDVIRVVAGDAR